MLFIRSGRDGYRLEGQSTAVEDGEAWAVRYDIRVDSVWRTRSARVSGRSASGVREVLIEHEAQGEWRVEGQAIPGLAGCVDVDLEASAFTNAFPVGRLALEVGEAADAPAAYVRTPDLRVERLEQRYARLEDDEQLSPVTTTRRRPTTYAAVLVFDESGLIVDYPSLALRVA